MQMIIRFQLFLILIITPLIGFSEPPNYRDNRQTVYCPQEIYCSKDEDLHSCSVVDGSHHWPKEASFLAQPPIQRGTYTFVWGQIASGPISHATCVYRATSQPGYSAIGIKSEKGAIFEAVIEKNYSWKDPDPHTSSNIAECDSTVASQCPMKEKPGLLVEQFAEGENSKVGRYRIGFYVGIAIKDKSSFTVHDDTGIFFLPFNDAAYWKNYCGGSQCTIYIKERFWDNHTRKNIVFDAGFIVVDLDDNMKILGVYNSSAAPYEIKKKTTFNLIGFVMPGE